MGLRERWSWEQGHRYRRRLRIRWVPAWTVVVDGRAWQPWTGKREAQCTARELRSES